MNSDLQPVHLRCEYLENPLGIDLPRPRVSWQLTSERRHARQTAYRLLVAKHKDDVKNGRNLLWDSGRVVSAESVNIPYAGPPLQADTRYFWTVQVWDGDGQSGLNPPVAFWHMGLLSAEQWQGAWITLPTAVDIDIQPPGSPSRPSKFFQTNDGPFELYPSPYLRRHFTLDSPVRRATLYATARGVYDLFLNGKQVGDGVFQPGWTDYNQRIEYQAFDVTGQLQMGANALGAILGDGWYAGYLGPGGFRAHYDDRPSFLAQLHVTLTDGRSQIITSDGQWRGSAGPLRYADFYHGAYVDTRYDLGEWTLPDYDGGGWQPVTTVAPPTAKLSAYLAPPIRVVKELKPIAVNEVSPGVYVFDMGQNMVGWVRLRVRGSSGTRLQVRHAEICHPDGRIDTSNLLEALATDIYVLRGEGDELCAPRFTYHGFRYVEISGLQAAPTLADVIGCVMQADLPLVGSFASSSELVNQVYVNALWGQRGNYLSVPTDCPQRAERLGWTGDIYSFAMSGAFNMDCAAYYKRWLQILLESQSDTGGFPNVAPRVVLSMDGAPAWADAGILMPWLLYRLYGDLNAVEDAFAAMERYLAAIAAANPNYLWQEGRQLDFGDWLSYNADTPTEVLATAVWALDALWLAEMAAAIGRDDAAGHYHDLHAHIKSAFRAAYISDDGHIHGDTQTVYALALTADLIPMELHAATTQHLVDDIEARGWHPSTGFVGTPFLMPALSDAGRDDVAARLLLQETCPSWGYMVRQGATTIWERWDGDNEMLRMRGLKESPPTFVHHKSGELVGMNSFNHFSLGSVVAWLYRYLLGIDVDPDAPGFANVIIHPHFIAGLDFARGAYHSIRGPIAVNWQKSADAIELSVTIPANVSATVCLPDAKLEQVREGESLLSNVAGIAQAAQAGNDAVVKIGSGTYRFQWTV